MPLPTLAAAQVTRLQDCSPGKGIGFISLTFSTSILNLDLGLKLLRTYIVKNLV
jgi:hypothetical protein